MTTTRLTIEIDEELKREVKIKALQRNITLRKLIVDYLKKFINK